MPEPHPDPVPSEIPGDTGQSPRWPTQAGRHREHQADNASPSMALCAGFPSGQKEGTISGASFLMGGYGGSGTAPACLCTLGFRPESLKKVRDLGMAQDPVLVSCTLWQREPEWPEELGRGRGLGKQESFRLHNLSSPASIRGPSGLWPLTGVRRRSPRSRVQSLPTPPPRRRPPPAPGPSRFVRPRARSLQRHTKLLLCQASSSGPGDVSLRDQLSSCGEDGLWRRLAAGGRGLGAPPSGAGLSPA